MSKKANGTEFESKFKKEMDKSFYCLRLRTPSSGYAGVTQPADFIVIGNKFNYAEAKETTKDVFYVKQMEQYPEMLKFEEDKRRLPFMIARNMRYYVIVHFISKGIKVITSGEGIDLVNQKKGLRWESECGMNFDSLEELRKGMPF